VQPPFALGFSQARRPLPSGLFAGEQPGHPHFGILGAQGNHFRFANYVPREQFRFVLWDGRGRVQVTLGAPSGPAAAAGGGSRKGIQRPSWARDSLSVPQRSNKIQSGLFPSIATGLFCLAPGFASGPPLKATKQHGRALAASSLSPHPSRLVDVVASSVLTWLSPIECLPSRRSMVRYPSDTTHD